LSADKNIEALAIMAKAEATPGTPPAVAAATDGIQVIEKVPRFRRTPLFDGQRPFGQGTLGRLQAAPKNGFAYEMSDLLIEPKGPGAAYSASVLPLFVNRYLPACGLTAAVSTTPGSEKVEYTPTAPTAVMGTVAQEVYERAKKRIMDYGFCSFVYTAPDTGIPRFNFSGMFRENAEAADAALPAITYPGTALLPPAAVGVTFTLGSYLTAKVREFSFDLGRRAPTARRSQLAAQGHAGFQWGPFEPRLSFLIEETALVGTPYHTSAGVNVDKLNKDSTVFGCGYKVGSVQYNRHEHQFPNGIQILDVEQTEEDSISMIRITAAPFAVSPVDSGWYKQVWD
jgi:hypothetical protein